MNSREKSLLEEKNQLQYLEELRAYVNEEVKKGYPRPVSYVETFGCQMNARDSEKLRGILAEAGFLTTEEEKEADLIIYNTCTVRENADLHVYGRLGRLVGYKKKNPRLLVGVCGCMMQEKQVVEKIRRSYPVVDLIFGTHNLFTFPELLLRAMTEKKKVCEIWDSTDEMVEHLPVKRKYSFKTGVNIMYGCNNFCSYCIVPYVRGRERSREPEAILEEVRHFAEDGVVEVMLLGQNVNSYGKTLEEPWTFGHLLRETANVDGIRRIRFMSSHPKDLTEELIDVIAEEPKICRHYHLPVQSGSDRILAAMNRRYTHDQYLRKVEAIRAKIPDISLTTDIIVGFPGETEEDFEETLRLVHEVGFDSVFTFIYSKRTGTPAAAMPDQIEDAVVHDRFDRLMAAVKEEGEKACSRFTGKTMDVLVEEVNKRSPDLVTGRISQNLIVHFSGTSADVGKIVPVRLDECKGFYYFGTRV